MDNELFELCKEVYKRFPEWKETDFAFCENELDGNIILPYYRDTENYEKWFEAPLYTSDYLLDKLPESNSEGYPMQMRRETDGWYFYYFGDLLMYGRADTPIKALLKLCLAFKEAGEI